MKNDAAFLFKIVREVIRTVIAKLFAGISKTTILA
jgi:hypothetical protein